MTTKEYINSRADEFYDYLGVTLGRKVRLALTVMSAGNNIFVLSGVIRDFFIDKRHPLRDFDFVYRQLKPEANLFLNKHFAGQYHFNSFGGFKLNIFDSDISYDIWGLDDTWGIKQQHLSSSPNSLIKSVFFNFSAIVYDWSNKKFIYDDNFVKFLETKTIDIVYPKNPNIELCLFNIIYYSRKYKLKISDKVKEWVRIHYHKDIDFDKVQNKHKVKNKISNLEIHKSLHEIMKVFNIDWDQYLSSQRLRKSGKEIEGFDKRNAFESDFGRVIFSSPLRRMHDKTQVIPLTSGDKIHTRLTHSLEVMNTASSLASSLCRESDFIKEYGERNAFDLELKISAILRTAAIVHDIGNPPFGHFGETIIKNYFKDYLGEHIMEKPAKLDYLEFDGNAQGFRILTKLSYNGYLSGFNLTFATLAAYMKYPNAGKIDKSYIGTKKHGVFITEKRIFDRIVEECHLRTPSGKIKRHPLSFLVEASDSICYNVMDIEDGYNLKWYDSKDLERYLDQFVTALINKNNSGGELDEYKIEENKYSFYKLIGFDSKKNEGLTRGHWMINFRVCLVDYLIKLAIQNFKNNSNKINSGEYSKELIEDDPKQISKALQKFTQRFIFTRPEIQKAELTGHSVLRGLFDILLKYVSSEDDAFRKRVKNIISKSTVKVAIHEMDENDTNGYKLTTADDIHDFDIDNLSDNAKLRMVVDFVAGMTDKFAVSLYQELSGLRIPN